ncbi:hypothetical protein [Sulfuricurvum sp.]|uniref:hypothetical protein n=1 Tax=Sulfuricurvum sp. TaxID=2025608 RepID=UPI003569731F
MTEVIIREMSQVTISDDLLKQVDMKGLIKKFRDNHARLDDFKKARDAHENRSFWAKLNIFDNTMKNAQLDATEIQAEFSKSLGQLMVISVTQSQYLQQQQEELARQQGIIKNQTEQIESQTHEIEKQHEVLAKQNADLEKLVNEYFELRGLTQDGAKKLISIANEIQHTRDDLLDSMEKSRNWITEQQEKTLVEISSKISVLEEHTKKNVDDIIDRCQTLESENDSLADKLSDINTIFSETTVAFSAEQEKLAAFTTYTDNRFIEVKNNFNTMQEEFKLYRENQHKYNNKIVAIFSVLAVVSFSSIAYLFFK